MRYAGALLPGDNGAAGPGVDAAATQQPDGRVGVVGGHHGHHADPQVQGPLQLVRRDLTGSGNQPEHRRWLPKIDLPPARGSANRVLTYNKVTDEAIWEGSVVRRNDPIP